MDNMLLPLLLPCAHGFRYRLQCGILFRHLVSLPHFSFLGASVEQILFFALYFAFMQQDSPVFSGFLGGIGVLAWRKRWIYYRSFSYHDYNILDYRANIRAPASFH